MTDSDQPSRPRHRPLAPPDLHALDFILDVFLPEAAARGMSVPTPAEVRPLLDQLAAEARAGGWGAPGGARPGWPGAAAPAPAGFSREPRSGPRTSLPPTAPPTSLPPRPSSRGPVSPRPSSPGPVSPGPVSPGPMAPGPVPPGPVSPGPVVPGSISPRLAALLPGSTSPQAPWPPQAPAGSTPLPQPWVRSVPPSRQPSAASQWWARVRQTVGSDLGVHGLAYLGVLLLFVGVFGLVAFAFGEVTPAMRPVAELAAAVVPFLGARLLLRSGAAVVGHALEVVGGLLLPLMLVTTLVDGYAFPAEPEGGALVVGLTAVCLASAALFTAVAHRLPQTGVRYAVGPALWLGAAMATIGVGRDIPSGQDVAQPSTAQAAAMAAALTLTLVLARRRPEAVLARAARTAALPGLVVVALLAVLSWAAQGPTTVPVACGGVLLLAAMELLRPVVPDAVADLVGPLWVGAVALVLGASSPTQDSVTDGRLVAAVVALVFVGLVELAGWRRGPTTAWGLPMGGAVVALLVLWPADWWTVGTLAAVGAWAVVRRARPFGDAALALDALAAILPVALAAAVAQAAAPSWGLAVGAGLVAAATVPAARARSARPGDDFWVVWWRCAAPALVVVTVVAAATLPTSGRWVATAAVAVVAVGAVVGPLGASVRPWAVIGAGALDWVLGATTAGAPDVLRGGFLAGVALATTVVPAVRGRTVDVGLGRLVLPGHVLALAAVGASGAGLAPRLAVGAATLGWCATAVRGEGPHAWPRLGALPWSLVAAGAPVTALLLLDETRVLPLTDPWRVLPVVASAVVAALAARWARWPWLARVAPWAAFASALVAVAMAGHPWPVTTALATVVAVVVLLPADRRHVVMTWTAWLAVAPTLWLLLDRLWLATSDVPVATAVAATLAAVGAALALGDAALRGDRWRGIPGPARSVGVLDAAAGLAAAVLVVPQPGAATLVLALMGAVLLGGVQARVGGLAGVAATGAWLAVLTLAWDGLVARPWVGVVVVAGLLLVAEGAHRMLAERRPWLRWDLPIALAALPVAASALAAGQAASAVPGVFVAVGLLGVAVAVRVRRVPDVAEVLGAAASALVLVGAGSAGPGWAALALLALGAAHTGLAVRARGPVRTARQVVGALAVVAAWGTAIAWLELTAQRSVDVTAVLASVVLLGLAVGARATRLAVSWLAVWGTAAAAVLLSAVAATLGASDAGPSAAVTVGLALAAAACLVAGGVDRVAGARRPLVDVAAWTALGTLLEGLAAGRVDDAVRVLVLCATGVLAVAAALVRRRRDPAGSLRPVLELGLGATGLAVALAVGVAADRNDAAILVPVLAVCAVQAGALGVVLRLLGPQLLAPVLACVAWVLAVSGPGGLGQTPEWYTVAVGLTLLAEVSLWRRDRRAHDLPPGPPEVVALELAGIAFLVGVWLVRAAGGPLDAAVAAALGLVVAGWGVGTRVRRRLAAGVVVVLVAVVMVVAVPLVRLVPAWSGAMAWVLLAVVGLVAVVVATFLERGRTAVRSAIGRVGEITADWE